MTTIYPFKIERQPLPGISSNGYYQRYAALSDDSRELLSFGSTPEDLGRSLDVSLSQDAKIELFFEPPISCLEYDADFREGPRNYTVHKLTAEEARDFWEGVSKREDLLGKVGTALLM